MKKWSTTKLVLSSLILFITFGVIYSATTPNIYLSKSQVALFRLKIENPDYDSEESRNRWIWIRDGLNLKSALITDTSLLEITKTNETAKRMAMHYSNPHTLVDVLRKMINIQFTGADENNFIVEVKAPSALLAHDLNKMVFDRIKYLATTADKDNFESLITQIKNKQLELAADKGAYAFYDDKIRKMTFNHLVEQKQKEDALKVISNPTINQDPIWPRPFVTVIIFAFIGAVLGFSLDFTFKNFQRE